MMKKSLLFAAAALMTIATVSAQSRVQRSFSVKSVVPAASSQVAKLDLTPSVATMATSAQRAARKAARKAVAPLKALYNRPAGSFYRSMEAGGGAYYVPMFYCPNGRNVTYPNASAGATSYTWTWEQYDDTPGVDSFTTRTSTEKDLVYYTMYNESEYAPTLTASNGSTEDSYQLFSLVYDDKTKQNTSYQGLAGYTSDPHATMMQGKQPIDAYVTPKFFSAGTRQGGTRGVVTYTGAADADGGKNGYWFGKNWAGYNGMALYVEQPESRYALRAIKVLYGFYSGTGDAPITATVYAASKAENDSLILGDVIAKGTANMTKDMPKDGFLSIPLTEMDDETGYPYEITADINQPIAITVTGYDNAAIDAWAMLISCDEQDEGYGQHGYMLGIRNDSIKAAWGLHNFFTTSLGVTAPTIFLDVEWPGFDFLYYNPQTGEKVGENLKFPKAGGEETVDFFSTHSSDEWTVVDENGNELPKWLTYQVSDSVEAATGNFTDHSYFKLTCAANEGANRACNVKISFPGAQQIIHVTQEGSGLIKGDINGDGIVNVTDVTALINAILGNDEYPNVNKDLNADGVVNVTDVTALINLILEGESK